MAKAARIPKTQHPDPLDPNQWGDRILQKFGNTRPRVGSLPGQWKFKDPPSARSFVTA